jgi:hypothetical protein
MDGWGSSGLRSEWVHICTQLAGTNQLAGRDQHAGRDKPNEPTNLPTSSCAVCVEIIPSNATSNGGVAASSMLDRGKGPSPAG